MQKILNDIAAAMAQENERGKVADYIPQLAHVDPNQFGISVVLPDGQVFSAGDAKTAFSIQSISKVFTLTMALGKLGMRYGIRWGASLPVIRLTLLFS